ncbi:hypothetical protein [Mycolicibacterium sediminis]|uniref:Uncharacterized protein n=1 Tax=Mycolicibacterium sediminis TaxID=1286180 RepID=A0A7I7QMK1_9MYCO|nr:hypothetical protein [Mycolicibacterium sediminis]BBY27541.1 hypothetical protein MSEDJ_16370 [Mycolicibacterium sediminis]
MPEDANYVDYLFGPLTYSAWWVVSALFVVLLIAAWIAGVWVWTLPVDVLRGIPVIRTVTFKVLRFKFIRTLNGIERSHRDGLVTTRDAFHDISRVFRLYVRFRTGYQAREMTATDVANSPLSPAALNVLLMAYPGQFNEVDPRTVPAVVDAARTAVATWT